MSLFNKFDFFKQKLKIYVQRNKINLGAQDTFLKNQLMNSRIPGNNLTKLLDHINGFLISNFLFLKDKTTLLL